MSTDKKNSYSKQKLFDFLDDHYNKKAIENIGEANSFTIRFKAPVFNKVINSWVSIWCQRFNKNSGSTWKLDKWEEPTKDMYDAYYTLYFVYVGHYNYKTPALKVDAIIKY